MLSMTARKKVIQGGTSAGKTYGIIPILIDKATKTPRLKITIVAETVPAVKEGAVTIFKDVMFDTNRFINERWNITDREYTFANGSKIQFKAYDSVGKAKASGKRDILFLNEANHIPFEIADALMIRSKETWIDFNPDNEFWVHREVMQEYNSEFLLLTYKDNEGCPPETIEDLLIKQEKAKTSEYWTNWCRVYIDGEIGSLQGVIFTNWKQIDTIPIEANLIGYGLDFGYSNDPTAIVEIYKYNDKRIINELCYQKGLSNRDISKFIKTSHTVYCDSAEPKSITELRHYGIRAEAVIKGADSINFGIQIMQEQEYLITSKSTNVINELRKYSWDTDKRTGSNLNRPIDMFNHAIDAIRYHEMMSLGKPNKGKYQIG